jgi:hypothetical protein
MVVHGAADDPVDPMCPDLAGIGNEAGKMSRVAGRREGAGDAEEDDAAVAEYLGGVARTPSASMNFTEADGILSPAWIMHFPNLVAACPAAAPKPRLLGARSQSDRPYNLVRTVGCDKQQPHLRADEPSSLVAAR